MKSKQFTIPTMPSSTSFCSENDSIGDFHFKQEKKRNAAATIKLTKTDGGNDLSNDNNNRSRSLLFESEDYNLPCIENHMDDKAMPLGASLSSIETIKVHNVNTQVNCLSPPAGKSSSRKLSVKLKKGQEKQSVSDVSLDALYPNVFNENIKDADDIMKPASLEADSKGSIVFVPQ